MGYQQYQKRLDRELSWLNQVIDEKIIQGVSYHREAKRHKELIRWARRMRRPSFLDRMTTLTSIFF